MPILRLHFPNEITTFQSNGLVVYATIVIVWCYVLYVFIDIDTLYSHLPESARSKVLYYPRELLSHESNVDYTMKLMLQHLVPSGVSSHGVDVSAKRNVVAVCGSLFVAAEVREYLAK